MIKNTENKPGEVWRKLRTNRGLSAAQVEEMTGVSDTTILRIENNKADRLDMSVLCKLAKLYGKDPDWICELYGWWEPGEEEENEEPIINELTQALNRLSPERKQELIQLIHSAINLSIK